MNVTPKRNDDEYVREGGPNAGPIRELVESGCYDSATEVVLDALSCSATRSCCARPSGIGSRQESE